MSTNSSNNTAEAEVGWKEEVEVGWQGAPNTRGTADILWNCTSLIILVAWTSFHPDIGHNWKQRAYTTMAILLPGLTAIVATRDYFHAYRLYFIFRRYEGHVGWKKSWTMKKSFLVVKGGIRAALRERRSCTASDSTRLVDVTSNDIIDAEKFLSLAMTGRIRCKDFPRTKEIDEKSQADWFSSVATLIQLVWAFANMICRLSTGCTVSVLEVLSLDWVVLGLGSAMYWWNCPQNINSAFMVPVESHYVLSEETSSEPDRNRSIEAVLDRIAAYQQYLKQGAGVNGWEGEKKGRSDVDVGCAMALMLKVMLNLIIHMFALGLMYQWHSGQFLKAWMVLSLFSTVSELIFILGDRHRRFDWGTTSIYRAYIQPLLVEPLRRGERIRNIAEWRVLVGGAINDEMTDSRRFLIVLAAILVDLICHCGKLVVALVAFRSAPRGIYKVPDIPVLEAIVHVGR